MRRSIVVSYRARHVFEVTLSEPGRAGEVIDAAVGNGATGVDDVRFTLSAETRHQLRQEALSEAMDNARGKARVLASGANLTITGVGAVSTTDLRVSRHREVMMAAAGGDGGTDIDSGPVTVTAQVVVTYNATAT